MRVALAQLLSGPDPTANLRQITKHVTTAAERGARLVVFPEATMCRFGEDLSTIAEPSDGPWADGVRQAATDSGVTVVAGMFTPGSHGRVHNTLLATGNGIDTTYDKIHLYEAFGHHESAHVDAGSTPVTVDIDGISVGLTTCYDVRFPWLYQHLGDLGAQLIVVAASWAAGPGKRDQWNLLVRARALDSNCFVLGCDQADPTTVGLGAGPGPTGIGASTIVDPFGAVQAHLGPEPGILVADVDPVDSTTARATIPVLTNRRF